MIEDSSIVVTGIGVFSSIGCTKDDFWNSLIAGKSGIKGIRGFDSTGFKSRIASEIIDFDPGQYMSDKLARRMARVSQLSVAASVEAVRDADLDLEKEDTSKIGCIIGSAAGDFYMVQEQFPKFEAKGPGHLNPFTVPKIIVNMPACNAAIVLGLHGPNTAVITACATGSHSIGAAYDLLRTGQADVMLAGGTEAAVMPYVVDAYDCMKVLSRRNENPERASRPFDADRDGFVIGEGAGVFVLESMKHARKRGAEPLAELKGFGMTCDAYSFALPEPSGKWAAAAIKHAIKNSGIHPDDIGYVNAHGTSTKANDIAETKAIKEVFKMNTPPVSSTKSMIGHTLGAAGAVEAAATVLALYHGCLPPTINYETKDPDCDLDVVPNEARDSKIKYALSNSFGFGGQNAVVVFGKV